MGLVTGLTAEGMVGQLPGAVSTNQVEDIVTVPSHGGTGSPLIAFETGDSLNDITAATTTLASYQECFPGFLGRLFDFLQAANTGFLARH